MPTPRVNNEEKECTGGEQNAERMANKSSYLDHFKAMCDPALAKGGTDWGRLVFCYIWVALRASLFELFLLLSCLGLLGSLCNIEAARTLQLQEHLFILACFSHADVRNLALHCREVINLNVDLFRAIEADL